jgi:hypothetical protein
MVTHGALADVVVVVVVVLVVLEEEEEKEVVVVVDGLSRKWCLSSKLAVTCVQWIVPRTD